MRSLSLYSDTIVFFMIFKKDNSFSPHELQHGFRVIMCLFRVICRAWLAAHFRKREHVISSHRDSRDDMQLTLI
jgi:hypothetical protein